MKLVIAAVALILILSGCDGVHDRIQETGDPCVFVLDFAPRCMPAGKTAICTNRRPVLARNIAKECSS